MIEMLTDLGLDGKDIRIVANLYWGQKATVRVENKQAEYINIQSSSVFKEALKNTN